jgi:hypothetical protein
MIEFYLFVMTGSFIWFKYNRKRFTHSGSQTEMVVIHKSTQTEQDDDSMSLDISDMEFDLDVDFFNRALAHEIE